MTTLREFASDALCRCSDAQADAWVRWIRLRSVDRVVSLESVRDERQSSEALELRVELWSAMDRACEQVGDDISGYALVVWDKVGDLRSAYNAARGPIGPGLVPTFVSDALNRHLAVMLAKEVIEADGDKAG